MPANAGIQAAAQAPSAAPPGFRTTTALVQVDVVVRDHDGRFVADLAKDDFEILEDGRPQAVDTFVLVGSPPTGGAAAPSSSAPGAPGVAPAGRPLFILVFDDEHLAPAGFKHVQTAAQAFVRRNFTGEPIGGLVTDGKMAGNHLTSDGEELIAAMGKLKPRGDVLARQYDLRDWPRLLSVEEAEMIAAGNQEVLDEAARRANQEAPPASSRLVTLDFTANVLEKARQIATEARPSTQRILTTLGVLLNGLQKFDGPKTIVFVSDGFFADERWSAVQQIVGLAARARTRIYSIDSRGLNFRGSNFTDTVPSNVGGFSGLLAAADTQSDGPNSLAVDTGGFVVRHTNDFDAAFEEINQDTRTYYLVGYRPANTNFDGKFRKIEVKVKRPGVTVRARKGYLATAPAAAAPADRATGRGSSTGTSPSGDTGAIADPAATPAPDRSADIQPALPAWPLLRPGAAQHVAQLVAEATSAGRSDPAASRISPAAEAESQARRAWERYQRGDLEGAAAAFAPAVSDPGAHAWVHYAYGLTEYGLNRFHEAVSQWEQVRASAPAFQPVYFDLADGYLRSDDPQQAIRTLRTAQERWPDAAEVYNALGVVQMKMGVVDEAIASFRKATDVAPTDGLGYFNLGKAYELRFVKSRHYVSSQQKWVVNETDRDAAVKAFQQYLEIGGPFDESARQELSRLQFQAAGSSR